LRSIFFGDAGPGLLLVLKSMLALEAMDEDEDDLIFEGLKILNLLRFFWTGESAMEIVDTGGLFLTATPPLVLVLLNDDKVPGGDRKLLVPVAVKPFTVSSASIAARTEIHVHHVRNFMFNFYSFALINGTDLLHVHTCTVR
jgi:hypothetical protein